MPSKRAFNASIDEINEDEPKRNASAWSAYNQSSDSRVRSAMGYPTPLRDPHTVADASDEMRKIVERQISS